MLSYNYSSKILNGFFDKDLTGNNDVFGNPIYTDAPIIMDTQDRHIYIGLFANYIDEKGDLQTGLPNNFGENGKEPGHWITVKDMPVWELWPEYSRIQLDCRSHIDKKAENLSLAQLQGNVAVVTSQEMLLFPEAYGDTDPNIEDKDAGWGVISGFGLYYAKSKDDPDAELFLWGTITGDEDPDGNTDVKIGRYQVPVIRKGGLTISLQ